MPHLPQGFLQQPEDFGQGGHRAALAEGVERGHQPIHVVGQGRKLHQGQRGAGFVLRE